MIKNKNKLLLATSIMATMLVLVSCGKKDSETASGDRVLNIYNWNDYIDEKTIPDFEAKTGIKVKYDLFDTNEVVEAKLTAGSSGYDIVVPASNFMERFVKAGLVQKLDKSKIPNYKNVDPDFYKNLAQFDPNNEHAINYLWGTTAIGYNVEKVTKALGTSNIDSWSVLFDPKNAAKLKSCGIGLMDSPPEVIGNALIYLGFNPNSEKEDELNKAKDLLKSIAKNVRYFDTARYINDIANGEICILIGFNGDVLNAQARAEEAKNNIKIKYLVPKEGAIVWFDTMVIPADAKNVAEAHEFLNYFLEPETTARISNHIKFANSNKASLPLLDKAVAENEAIFPSEAAKAKLVALRAYTQEYDRKLTKAWTEIKASTK
ncbi:MAG: polyamine ABC transporter substrate-binding protein [Methylacidiphilales bacterium]|nr:polyamine ABC transporter substrate-binding protein [Candidatus Methylacidiphilales bacterium]